MSLIPGTDKFLFMERYSGKHPDKSTIPIVGYYDYMTNRFTNVNYTTDTVFCSGHTITQVGMHGRFFA